MTSKAYYSQFLFATLTRLNCIRLSPTVELRRRLKCELAIMSPYVTSLSYC